MSKYFCKKILFLLKKHMLISFCKLELSNAVLYHVVHRVLLSQITDSHT